MVLGSLPLIRRTDGSWTSQTDCSTPRPSLCHCRHKFSSKCSSTHGWDRTCARSLFEPSLLLHSTIIVEFYIHKIQGSAIRNLFVSKKTPLQNQKGNQSNSASQSAHYRGSKVFQIAVTNALSCIIDILNKKFI